MCVDLKKSAHIHPIRVIRGLWFYCFEISQKLTVGVSLGS